MNRTSNVQINRRFGFSLVEVVLALGIVAFAIVAILGLIPIGLQTSHSSQDETRAAQMAQGILSSLEGENLKVNVSGQPILDAQSRQQLNDTARLPSVTNPINLGTPASYSLYANNDGQVSDANAGAVYSITVAVSAPPSNFDAAYASIVTVSVAWPATAPTTSQTRRDFVRIITAY